MDAKAEAKEGARDAKGESGAKYLDAKADSKAESKEVDVSTVDGALIRQAVSTIYTKMQVQIMKTMSIAKTF